MIKVFYTPTHKIHFPKKDFIGNAFVSHSEIPQRIETIKNTCQAKLEKFEFKNIQKFPDSALLDVHSERYIKFLKDSPYNELATLYPSVFPVKREIEHLSAHIEAQHGFFVSDLSTPLGKNTFTAAREAVNVSLSATKWTLDTHETAYALVRPPGHHAESETAGGFCYLNNAAIAAAYCVREGKKVIILDIDFHHGNGTQNIFYETSNVLYVSLHGDPNDNFPYYSGFKDECGKGEGKGYNYNFPLPTYASAAQYLETLEKALEKIKKFTNYDLLLISFGLDIYHKDEIGAFNLNSQHIQQIGQKIATMHKPSIVIQEGGYYLPDLGKNVLAFFSGLLDDESIIR